MTYTVNYERDEAGWWVATVREVPGCHTQGRTIEQARRRIREALSLFGKNRARAELREVVKPATLQATVERSVGARQEAEQAETRAQAEMKAAAHALTKRWRLSLRDAGDLLGLSFQRVQQLTVPKKKVIDGRGARVVKRTAKRRVSLAAQYGRRRIGS